MRTAREVSHAARAGLGILADAEESKMDAFRAVSRLSGLSVSLIGKFYYGKKQNPSIDTIDKLNSAVRHLINEANK